MEHTIKDAAPKKSSSLLRKDTTKFNGEIIKEDINSALNSSRVQHSLSNFNRILKTAMENSFVNRDLSVLMPTLVGFEIIDGIEKVHLYLPKGIKFDEIERELTLEINSDNSEFSLTLIGNGSIEAIDINSNIYIYLSGFKDEPLLDISK